MPLLIDGYNVIYQLGLHGTSRGGDWLQRARQRLVSTLIAKLDSDLLRTTTVVFDARQPPPDRPDQHQLAGLKILFARDYPEADDLIEELIRREANPKSLIVVSSDHRLHRAARRRKAQAVDAEVWYARWIEQSAAPPRQTTPTVNPSGREPVVSDEELRHWLAEFGEPPPEEPK